MNEWNFLNIWTIILENYFRRFQRVYVREDMLLGKKFQGFPLTYFI